MFFSKSKYCGFWQCPKIAWLDINKPEEKSIDDNALNITQKGNEVGDYAMGLFGDYVEVTTKTEDGKLNKSAMIKKTEEELAKGTENICEASFSYDGFYCAVDILHKENGGYAIYEVKSTKSFDAKKPNMRYVVDIACQKYILDKCGINVTGTYIVYLNGFYVKNGEIDKSKLFLIKDVSELIKSEYDKIEDNLDAARQIVSEENEPHIEFSEKCNGCSYWEYCSKDLPKPNVFDIYNYYFKNKLALYNAGKVSFSDVENYADFEEKQKRQIDYALHDRGIYADKENIRAFLKTLTYPLYFLDYETMSPVIPLFDGTKPYQQIPFQYSLHYIEEEGGELKHKEFLAESGVYPCSALAESLIKDIPTDKKVTVCIFNKSTEPNVTKRLAEEYSDLSDRLMSIVNSMVDLLDVFRNGWYYKREIGGNFSQKNILPALFPNDPVLNYHNLDGVHNGSEAMDIFPKIKDMPTDEQKVARENLLRYCELDTLTMVKVWEELKRVSQ